MVIIILIKYVESENNNNTILPQFKPDPIVLAEEEANYKKLENQIQHQHDIYDILSPNTRSICGGGDKIKCPPGMGCSNGRICGNDKSYLSLANKQYWGENAEQETKPIMNRCGIDYVQNVYYGTKCTGTSGCSFEGKCTTDLKDIFSNMEGYISHYHSDNIQNIIPLSKDNHCGIDSINGIKYLTKCKSGNICRDGNCIPSKNKISKLMDGYYFSANDMIKH